MYTARIIGFIVLFVGCVVLMGLSFNAGNWIGICAFVGIGYIVVDRIYNLVLRNRH